MSLVISATTLACLVPKQQQIAWPVIRPCKDILPLTILDNWNRNT